MALLTGCVWLVDSSFSGAAPPEFDLVIRHGRIVDGTGNPWFHADVAIKADRIVSVGNVRGDAKREIDARGLVVAPGFIDIHSHSDWLLLEDGSAPSKIRQGVTTEVLGEGGSAGPSKGKLVARPVSIQNQPAQIRTLGEYFAAVERSGVAVNVASYVGQGNIWQCVMGQSFDRPGPAEMEKMKELVAEAMRDGAFGLATALMMPPGSLATTQDLVELCKVVREHGGIYSSHIRDEGLGVFDAVKQAIEIGERAGVSVDIIHVKIADQKYWGRMNEVIALIENARRRGVNVQANVYPYTRGNNDLSSIIPPWAHEGGRVEMVKRLKDPMQRAKLKLDIQNGLPGWYNHYTAVGGDWSRMLVSANNPYKGMTMDRVIARKSEGKVPTPEPLDVLVDLLIEQDGSVSTVYAHHTEEDMNLALIQPWCSIGSDGSALASEGLLRRGHPHPRNFGTFPRVLGVYVRERGLLRLEDAVRKMTSLNAAKLGLRDRGLLREGMFADITVFHPARVTDRSTYEAPFQYSEGIEHVIVNGQLVLAHGTPTSARPGRALRHDPGDSSRSSRRNEAQTSSGAQNATRDQSLFTSAATSLGKTSEVSPLPPGEKAKQLTATHAGEGPAWHVASRSLYFTGGNRITRLDADGMEHVFRAPSGGANGLLFDHQGRLVACEAGNRRVTRTEADGRITVLADTYQGMKFNTPNDLAIDSKGRIYFSDPRYGPRDTMEMRDANGRLVEGVYRIDAPGTVERVIAHEVERPNGLLVSPDGRHLFVTDNNNNTVGGARKLWRFDLLTEGGIEPQSRRLIYDWKTSRGPDGLKMDQAGRLFVAAGLNKANPPYETVEPHSAGIYILSNEGNLLDFVPVPKDEVTNCSFAGNDLKTLYITAGGSLWSIRVNTPGWSSAR
jgi:N-acyl-D-aspartate/D-glutamate deacylase/sugar lactone lactonase YvrE